DQHLLVIAAKAADLPWRGSLQIDQQLDDLATVAAAVDIVADEYKSRGTTTAMGAAMFQQADKLLVAAVDVTDRVDQWAWHAIHRPCLIQCAAFRSSSESHFLPRQTLLYRPAVAAYPVGQNRGPDLDRDLDGDSDQDSKQDLDQDSERDLDQDLERDLDQDLDQGTGL